MMSVRPYSPRFDPLSYWSPQPTGLSPDTPASPEPLVQQELEIPISPSTNDLTSVMFVPTGCAVQLPLDDNQQLLLEPEPTSVLKVSLQGHTVILVPEGLSDSGQTGQSWFLPASLQGAAHLDMNQDPFSVQPPSFRASASESLENPEEDPEDGFMMPWMNAPAGLAPGYLFSSTGVCSPLFESRATSIWRPYLSSSSERYAPWSIWSLRSSMLWPLPSSPLQPLPPSPPNHQDQDLQKSRSPSRPRCKAQRRLF
ncbi:proline-rich protein 23A3-like [Psammomys obesus]|uniref:proline-rich protein 23A3-like n=1 Tax=Psammomys obesus TaxID=48139 RepID=UPI0024529BD3|nr:proline-rich protein 23A3-like [Psammomys obesus]